MKTYRVELVDLSSTTVTAACMNAGDGFVRFFKDNEDFDPEIIAVFTTSVVVSVVEVKPKSTCELLGVEAPEEAPKLPTLSRKHPVYAYGKGDLKEALQRCLRDEGLGAWRYLGDIIRDLHVGK